MPWLEVLSKCMYIGSPHEGSALEKIGHFSGEVVRHIPRESINHWADWIDQRSDGIQDLKQGLTHISGEKIRTSACDSFAESARHYFISGSVGNSGSGLIARAMGDAIVRQNSANPASAPVHSQNAHFEGLTHTPLANSDRVYQQIAAWVGDDEQGYRHKMGGKSLDVMNYAPLRKPYFPEDDPYDPSSQALLAGTIDLVASAYDKTLEAVETVHYSIAEEPFYALQKLPLLSQIAKPVERTHREILDVIYRSLRFGGKIVHRAAKKIAPDDSAIAKLV